MAYTNLRNFYSMHEDFDEILSPISYYSGKAKRTRRTYGTALFSVNSLNKRTCVKTRSFFSHVLNLSEYGFFVLHSDLLFKDGTILPSDFSGFTLLHQDYEQNTTTMKATNRHVSIEQIVNFRYKGDSTAGGKLKFNFVDGRMNLNQLNIGHRYFWTPHNLTIFSALRFKFPDGSIKPNGIKCDVSLLEKVSRQSNLGISFTLNYNDSKELKPSVKIGASYVTNDKALKALISGSINPFDSKSHKASCLVTMAIYGYSIFPFVYIKVKEVDRYYPTIGFGVNIFP